MVSDMFKVSAWPVGIIHSSITTPLNIEQARDFTINVVFLIFDPRTTLCKFAPVGIASAGF